MPKICYAGKNFQTKTLEMIVTANRILEEYERQGFQLTLRQLFYQFVARGLIPNTDKSYNRLGTAINDGRLAGLIDWRHIVDRTRNLRKNNHWTSPEDIVSACAAQYEIDKWEDQQYRVEVWVEKDALVDVVQKACKPLDVPFFSCRGYTSQSEMWTAGMRLLGHWKNDQEPIVLHLGDHDPSGIDMTRDIGDRLATFVEHHGYDAPRVVRIALTMNQIEEYDPPPNPAKVTDSRADAYIAEFGKSSWELDALEPQVLVDLITNEVENFIHEDRWSESVERETEERGRLRDVSKRWAEVCAMLDGEED